LKRFPLGAAAAVSFLAPAKLNISLRVFGKRPDGYHHIRSVMVPVSLYDEVTVAEAQDGISVECDDASVPTGGGNTCRLAAAQFMDWAGLPAGVRIRIRKKIPVQAGLGGGSSDAAATLKGLSALTGRCPPPDALLRMAVRVGADVPFFTLGGAALVEGVGEKLTPIPWNAPFHAVIVSPPFGLSTSEGYARLRRPPGGPPPAGVAPAFRGIGDVAAAVSNDFEEAWAQARPEVGAMKEELLAAGAVAAGLSGSGSAVFGLFASAEAARAVCRKLSPSGGRGVGRRVFVARSV
jgi:4-diphosphocytidyl-2-C-methyl-D-erythritol kinase